jgi:hypothetical protein
MTDAADLEMLRQDVALLKASLIQSDAQLTDVRRVLCAAESETTYAAARRVVHRGLQVRLKVQRLAKRLDLQNAELDLIAQEFRETLASDLQDILIP